MKIKKMNALLILAQHGFTPTEQTYVGLEEPTGSSFYEELGDKPEYNLDDIKHWLGY